MELRKVKENSMQQKGKPPQYSRKVLFDSFTPGGIAMMVANKGFEKAEPL